MMPYEPFDVKSLLGWESYRKLTSYQVVHEMQTLKVAEKILKILGTVQWGWQEVQI
jgi:hypothetical protein